MSNLGKRISKLGPNQRKVLLLLLAGVGLGLSRTPRQYLRVLKAIPDEWSRINRQSLERAIHGLYKSKLVGQQEHTDGSLTLILTDIGKERALTYNIGTMQIKKPKHWDGKWRMVLFDIPEKRRQARDALRETLKRLGFYEFQKSAFIHPYECWDEVDYVVEFFNLRPHVRMLKIVSVDNELHLIKIFNLA